MYSATHESLTVALGQRWENTGRVKNQLQIAGFVTVPSKKKKNKNIVRFIISIQQFGNTSVGIF